MEPAIAKLFGYHVPRDRPSVARRDAELAARQRTLSPEEQRTAYGENTQGGPGGCLKKARAQVMEGAPEIDVALFNRQIKEAFDASQQNEEVRKAFRSWSDCMTESGFRL
ncbi:hypothetical protein ACWD4G_42305 [Streptomyces sp. NPDC002643]